MLTANAIKQTGNYVKYYTTALFDSEAFEKAQALFNEYKTSGVILDGGFADDTWRFTNQLVTISINFHFNEVLYHKNAGPWIGCKFTSFVKSVKTYAMFKLGGMSIQNIRDIVHSFHALPEMSEDALSIMISDYSSHMAELLAALPGESNRRDIVIESLEERVCSYRHDSGINRQRVLSGLGTYFRFNDALQKHWDSSANDKKLFWFPLYLWWNVTAILPLRPTEFLLTPRECLSHRNSKNILALRRTTLKSGGKKFTYRIDEDYEIVRYEIPDALAREITWYIEATVNMESAPLSTLFVLEPHYAHFERKPHSRNCGYYSYTNLSTCLRHFQEMIMEVDKESKIFLGDTRHLAMIGLILSGGSPLICKELAGHDDINISSHYYSNISSFIKCAAYEAHLKSRTHSAELVERKPTSLITPTQRIPVQDGFCSSEVYSRGEIYDCAKSINTRGEIGDCKHCPYFIDGESGVQFLYASPLERKAHVDRDSQYLLQTLEAVRRGIGLPEDIQTALLRLQQSSVWYGRSLQIEWEANGYGKTEKNYK